MPKILIYLILLACLFLSLVGGAFLGYFGLLPGTVSVEEQLIDADQASAPANVQAVEYARHPLLADNFYRSDLPQQSGVPRYDAARAANGYTLYAPVGPGFPIRLIDMAGDTVHSWSLDATLWPTGNATGQAAGVTGSGAATMQARLLPQGDLLVVIDGAAGSEHRGSIARLDKNSNVLWLFRGLVGNAADIGPAEVTYALLQEQIEQPWPGLEHIETPFFDELIVELDASGNVLRTISLLAAIQNSSFQFLLQYARAKAHGGQLLGTNSIQYLDAEAAARLPGASPGDVLVSFTQLDTVAVVDLKRVEVKWAARGSWHLQHAAEILASGNVLLFDNYGDLKNGGRSRVLEFDPVTLEIVWEFPRATGVELFSSGHGSQQRLSNGNTLISETFGGRLLEVAPDGDVVWEYHAPEVLLVDESMYVSHAVHAQRYMPDQLDFLPKTAGVRK